MRHQPDDEDGQCEAEPICSESAVPTKSLSASSVTAAEKSGESPTIAMPQTRAMRTISQIEIADIHQEEIAIAQDPADLPRIEYGLAERVGPFAGEQQEAQAGDQRGRTRQADESRSSSAAAQKGAVSAVMVGPGVLRASRCISRLPEQVRLPSLSVAPLPDEGKLRVGHLPAGRGSASSMTVRGRVCCAPCRKSR